MDIFSILAPYDEETFFRVYWEEKPLHIERAQPNYFDELLTLASINTILSQQLFRADECKVARDGEIVPQSAYIAESAMRIMGKTASDYVNTTQLLGLFSQGATLVFPQLNHKWRPLQLLKEGLEHHLSTTVVTNVFLSNRNSQGFSAHYDSHDVLVLQLHGTKVWSIYDSPIELPLKSQAFGKTQVKRGPLTKEVTLQAGDVLYLPRGYFHEAKTMDSISLHVTLGLHPYLWIDYVNDLLSLLGDTTVALRKSVPRTFLELEEAPRLEHIKAALCKLIEPSDSACLATQVYEQAINKKLKSSMRSIGDHLNEIVASEDLTPCSRLAKRDKTIEVHVKRKKNAVIMSCLGQNLVFPITHEPIIEALCDRSAFTIAELPNSLSLDQKIKFVRKLVGIGLLVSVPV